MVIMNNEICLASKFKKKKKSNANIIRIEKKPNNFQNSSCLLNNYLESCIFHKTVFLKSIIDKSSAIL